MGGQTYEGTFPGSTRRVYSAAIRAAAELGYNIIESKPEAGILSFNSGRSMKSWSGQDMTATVLDAGAGKCRVVLGGATAMRGNPFGGGGQLITWGEKGDVANRFLQKLGAVVPQTPEPAPSHAPAAPAGLGSELQKLADLHKQGLLTPQQFEAAKAKLLSGHA